MSLQIFFLNEGNAYYPSLDACTRYLEARGYPCKRAKLGDIDLTQDHTRSVFWKLMGFYRKRIPIPHAALIHEYRSSSLTPLASLKDAMKRHLVPRPDFRLFQTPYLEQKFNHRDGVPYGILGLGVPDYLVPAEPKGPYRYDFGYVGQLSDERRLSDVLDAFIARYGASRSLCLIGQVWDGLDARYSGHANIHFLGRLPQNEALDTIRQCRIGLAYFPYHMPHRTQPPTKLYEYAAMGMRIWANDSPGNLQAIADLDIKAHVAKGLSFPDFSELESLPSNASFDPRILHWDALIERSGILDFLDKKRDEIATRKP